MNNNNTINRLSNSDKLIDIIEQTGEKLKQDIRVSTLAFYLEDVASWNGTYKIIAAKPFPLLQGQTEYIINAYLFDDISFAVDDIVTIIFADLDFSAILESNIIKPRQITNKNLHSNSYGIVIPYTKTTNTTNNKSLKARKISTNLQNDVLLSNVSLENISTFNINTIYDNYLVYIEDSNNFIHSLVVPKDVWFTDNNINIYISENSIEFNKLNNTYINIYKIYGLN